jgi:hypothetical protein
MEAVLSRARTAPRMIAAGIVRYLVLLGRELPGSVRRQKLMLGVIGAYWIGGIIVGRIAGVPPAATISTYFPTYMVILPFMIVALVIVRGFNIMVFERPRRPLTQLVHEFRTSLATPRRVARALPLLIGMLVCGGTFTVVKASIPSIAPFAWDATFEHVDRLVHGGIAPWELLQPIFGYPLITAAINVAYNFWFYFLAVTWVWQAFSKRDDALRMQFFLTLTLGWILIGNVAAMYFSSAGPCYFGRITGLLDPYVPLMSYLLGANDSYAVWALTAQEMLWQNYQIREMALGAGISAMPSMHVAMATLFALLAWRFRRWIGIVATIYAVIVMIGSVHLGWHYAVDGYFGAAAMASLWWINGRVARWATSRQPAEALAT